MPNFISEDQIEKAIIQIFENNPGHRYSNCMDKEITSRLTENEVVIKPLLKQQLLKLNPTLPESANEDVYQQICQTRLDKSDLMVNKEIYSLIKMACG
ncbi:MAG: type I restriction endonuclease [Parafilimonas sp.]